MAYGHLKYALLYLLDDANDINTVLFFRALSFRGLQRVGGFFRFSELYSLQSAILNKLRGGLQQKSMKLNERIA
jgi:hypothetical protein